MKENNKKEKTEISYDPKNYDYLPPHYTDERTGISYTLQGDYYLPDLTLPEQPKLIDGIYSRAREDYLKNHCRGTFTNLLTQCKLNEHLNDVQTRAAEMAERLTKEMKEREGVTEKLKADDMMAWVRKMENIQNRVREIVFSEVVYA